MAKYEFKVGDRVKFKEWDEMAKEYGGVDEYGDIRFSYKSPFFDSQMKHLCGTYATVKEIYSEKRRVYLSDMTAMGDKIWSYTFDMLKPANAKKKVNEPKEPVKEAYGFKHGDKVTCVGLKDDIVFEVVGKHMHINKMLTVKTPVGGHNGLQSEQWEKFEGEHYYYLKARDLKLVESKEKIESVIVYPTITAHTIEGNKTTVMLSDGRIGEVTCYYKDTFDLAVGLAEAYKKALTSNDYKLSAKNITCGTIHSDNISCVGKPKVVEVRRKAKVGEWVKILRSPYFSELDVGDITCVMNVTDAGGIFAAKNKTIYPSGLHFPLESYVVLENYTPETPKPKFEVGKKYVVGNDIEGENGNVIEITECTDTRASYKTITDKSGFTPFPRTFYFKSCFADTLTPYTEPEISPDWERVLYVVKKLREEKASNQVKEVKRVAKVGEWVKVRISGQIKQIDRECPFKFPGCMVTTDGEHLVTSERYVVLEGYQPKK